MADITLRRGSIGEAVRTLQMSLISLGYDVGRNTKADGKFGPATEAGIRAFQVDNGLSVTGIWTDADQAIMDKVLEDEHGPVENDDEEMVLVPKSWLGALKSLVGEV